MKQVIFLLCCCLHINSFAQETGHEIKVTLKPFKNQYIYLGHYYSKQRNIVDSVILNDKSEAVFKGDKPLGGGIYLIGFPDRSTTIEFLVDKEQRFSIEADTSNYLENVTFKGSLDNTLFNQYQSFMAVHGRQLDSAYKNRASASNKADSANWNSLITQLNKKIQQYRDEIAKNNPDATITFLFKAMSEPLVPAAEQHPGGKYDSAYAYRYFKSHFWDGVNFYDERLVRTPFFEPKLDRYFEQLVHPSADSVKKEIDWMMSYANTNDEMQRFLLVKFINRYLNQRYMWEDAVFVHLFEKYFAQKEYPWLSEKGKKTITDRAYSLMANIMGNPAAEIDLPDTSGKHVSLYGVEAPYIVLAIWDANCGHCKEVLPKLDTLYRTKWKDYGVKMFGLSKETDGSRNDWLKFIRDHKLSNWIHVYYSKADDKARIDAGIPGYSQLYDVLSFPTLYLLDKEKRIIAKKLSYEQIDDVLQHRTRAK